MALPRRGSPLSLVVRLATLPPKICERLDQERKELRPAPPLKTGQIQWQGGIQKFGVNSGFHKCIGGKAIAIIHKPQNFAKVWGGGGAGLHLVRGGGGG